MKFYSLFLCLLIAAAATAQQKFIEVKVSDTVMAKADVFIYRVGMPFAYMGVSDYTPPPGENTADTNQDSVLGKGREELFSTVKAELKNKGFSLLPPSMNDSFRLLPVPANYPSVTIVLHSIDSLAQLCLYLKKYKYITGSIEMATTGNERFYQDRLYKKLLEAAANKAKSISRYSNQHVTGVLSVTEQDFESKTGGWISYPPLSALGDASEVPGWHTTITGSSHVTGPVTQYPIVASFVVRFSVE